MTYVPPQSGVAEDDRGCTVEAVYQSKETGRGAVLRSCPYTGVAWLDLIDLDYDPIVSDAEMGVPEPYADWYWADTEH